MKIAVPREIYNGERRVGITPDCISSLKKMGFHVFVESGAGLNSSFTDEDYKKNGAKISSSLKDLYKNEGICSKIALDLVNAKKWFWNAIQYEKYKRFV